MRKDYARLGTYVVVILFRYTPEEERWAYCCMASWRLVCRVCSREISEGVRSLEPSWCGYWLQVGWWRSTLSLQGLPELSYGTLSEVD